MTIPRLVHESHPGHALQLEYVEESYVCNFCKEVGFGKRYACPNSECDFHMHKDCFQAKREIYHVLLPPRRKLSLKDADDENNYCCDACCEDINGSYYHWEKSSTDSRVRHDLHPCCALLPLQTNHTISAELGVVVLFLRNQLSDYCDLCGLKMLSNGTTSKGWGYVSKDKKYQVHLSCVRKKLNDYREDIRLGVESRSDGHGESSAWVLKVINPPDQSQIESRDSHVSKNRNKRKGRMVSTVNKMLRIVFDLVVAVLLGNPAGLIVDVGSLLFFT